MPNVWKNLSTTVEWRGQPTYKGEPADKLVDGVRMERIETVIPKSGRGSEYSKRESKTTDVVHMSADEFPEFVREFTSWLAYFASGEAERDSA
jgi:hypothetical protein